MRILVVEDDAVFRRGLALMFPASIFEVTQAGDGLQALQIVSEQDLDLVICDYRLPGANGLEVLSHLRHASPSTPFFLVTAHYSEELAREARERGATAVFEKPIALEQFRRHCEQALLSSTEGRWPI